jgi:hypothetical protein
LVTAHSGWVTWHFTVDDREVVQHLLPTEQGDHADYGGPGDRQSIGVEICEFRNRARQSVAIDRATHLTAALANRYDIPTARIVPTNTGAAWNSNTANHARGSCSNATAAPPAAGGWARDGSALSRELNSTVDEAKSHDGTLRGGTIRDSAASPRLCMRSHRRWPILAFLRPGGNLPPSTHFTGYDTWTEDVRA